MAQKKNSTNLTELLLKCMVQPVSMLCRLEWLCAQLMEAEVSQQLSAEKSERSKNKIGCRCGCRPRRFNTRTGTIFPIC